MVNIKSIILLLCLSAAVEVLAEKGDVAIEHLTEELCGEKRKGCCKDMAMGDSPNMMKCMAIHSAKIPHPDESDVFKLMKFISCFIECIYKKSKYIGKGESINMKMVKLDAEQLFPNRTKEQEYYVNAFEFCRKDVLPHYNAMKNTPAFKAVMKDTCRPYLLFIHLCHAEYHQKNECPYFRWSTGPLQKSDSKCKEAKEKCYAIDGIPVPSERF